MKVKEPDLSGTYTYADYLTWRMDEMVELIHGKIYKMSPAPASKHQLVAGELYRQIANYLLKKPCQVFIAPFDVRLPSSKKKGDEFIDTVVQPDICVVCDAYKIDDAGCLGAPDWIIEILSSHTSHKDIRTKYDVYEKSKVKEYWVIHPNEELVYVYVLDAKEKYEGEVAAFTRTAKLVPKTLPGLKIDLKLVFPKA